jgi:hypothetical protein
MKSNIHSFLSSLGSSLVLFSLLVCSSTPAGADEQLPVAVCGSSYSFAVVTDPVTPAGASYSASGLPAGTAINVATGIISGIPREPGSYACTITILSSLGRDVYSVVLPVKPASGTPVITGPGIATGTVGLAFVCNIEATGSPVSYNAGTLPLGLGFEPTRGKISGVPLRSGLYSIALSANNAVGLGSTFAMNLTVNPAGALPTISLPDSLSAASGSAFTMNISATGSPVSYSADGLPEGLTLNSATGQISGTPNTPGAYSVVITATNANGTSTAKALGLVIGNVPTMTQVSALKLYQGRAMAPFGFSASNSPVSFNLHGLPEGLAFDTVTGVLSGTPTTLGAYSLGLSANNNLGTGPAMAVALSVEEPVQVPSFIALSARAMLPARADAGEDTLIVGFIMNGSAGRQVLLQGLGPALANTSVQKTLADPAIELYGASGLSLGANDNCASDAGVVAARSRTGATPLGAGAKDSSLLPTLAPGAYTMHLRSVDGSKGVAMAEVFDAGDLSTTATQRLTAISARGLVSSGEGALIGGFTISGKTSKRVLMRALGPDLMRRQVAGIMADPVLRLHALDGTKLAENDQWEAPIRPGGGVAGSTAAEIADATAKCMLPALQTGSRDAALVLDLAPGSYTVVVTSATGEEKVAMLEIYEVP